MTDGKSEFLAVADGKSIVVSVDTDGENVIQTLLTACGYKLYPLADKCERPPNNDGHAQ